MTKTLINSWEVRKYSKIDLPGCDLRKIKNTEELDFIKCFGTKLYQKLIDDLMDYSKVNSYEHGKNYVQGDLTIYKGFIYKAISANSQMPTSIEHWELARKFKTSCFERLWCNYLGEYLALLIIRKNVVPTAIQLTPNGLVRQVDKSSMGFIPSTDKELHAYLVHLDSQIADCFELIDYVMRKNEDDCFSEYKGLDNNCCDECGESDCDCTDNCLTKKKSKNRYHVA